MTLRSLLLYSMVQISIVAGDINVCSVDFEVLKSQIYLITTVVSYYYKQTAMI